MSVTFEQTLGPGTGFGAGFVFVRTEGLLSCYKAEAQKRAQKAYMEKFVRVEVRMTADERDTIKARCAARGESVNGFINRAIQETMEREKPVSGEIKGV